MGSHLPGAVRRHRRIRPRRSDQRGQILVLFALSLTMVLAMTGLALDAASTYAQRRGQQSAADLAALAAANHYLLTNDEDAAIGLAESIAADNGYTDGTGDVTVDVAIDTTVGIDVSVAIGDQHENAFLGVVGMPSWGIGTSAHALAGFPDTAYGTAPFIFSIGAFDDAGTPLYQTLTAFGDTNDDAPTGPTDFAWTNFGTGNVNTSQVRDIIDGDLVIDKELQYGEYIGQHNNGNHTALFGDVDTHLSGETVPVAVTDNNGNFMGWSSFYVDHAVGGSTKKIYGYFMAGFSSGRLSVTTCTALDCPRYLGSYVLKLAA
jgi:Flp pilus assembly protein TadG